MKLSQLLPVDAVRLQGRSEQKASVPDPEIGSVHYRAQEVRPGGLFVAIEGHAVDGHDFIPQALRRGAAAVLVQKSVADAASGSHAAWVWVENTRRALARVAARFYNHPSRRMVVIGITGTNGKTTTAYLVESILNRARYCTGVIGTINYRYNGREFENPVTTPESLDLQRILADMHRAGVTHVVMEASSHAIALHRIDSCWFDVGVFTNLSQDHLDFHGDMESYWAVKKQFFTQHLSRGPKADRAAAVINCDDPYGEALCRELSLPVIATGLEQQRPVRAEIYRCDRSGIRAVIHTPAFQFELQSSLVGTHNVANLLSAAGVGVALGVPAESIKDGLEAVARVPGRVERIAGPWNRSVYVDYAHTPDALKNVITSLRKVTSGRLICVFGCGGDRDRQKRPLMGEIAAALSDLAVVTSDNPRTEDPVDIIDDILAGVRRVKSEAYRPERLAAGFKNKGYVVEPDRRRAIALGIRAAQNGDTVLIAGKGHETYQILGTTRVDFDDRQEARRVLESIGNG